MCRGAIHRNGQPILPRSTGHTVYWPQSVKFHPSESKTVAQRVLTSPCPNIGYVDEKSCNIVPRWGFMGLDRWEVCASDGLGLLELYLVFHACKK